VPNPRFPGYRRSPGSRGGRPAARSGRIRTPSFIAQNKFLNGIRAVIGLLAASAIAGGLVAGIALPAVGTIGTVVRNASDKFNTLGTPDLHSLPVRSEILDRHGKLLAYYYPRGIDRVPVTYSQIAPVMRTSIVAIEDSRFWLHGAIDFRGTIRALVNDLEHKPIQGGSTLAEQYVKNVQILSSPNPGKAFASATEDTIGRKIVQLRMAVRVEHTMSKEQILAGYLNVAYFDNNSYGVQVAAQRYFSTTAAKLTLPQAATLAGMVENPSYFDPLNFPSHALARRNVVLARMYQLHDITKATEAAALKAPLGLKPTIPQSGCTSKTAKYAGYLCDYVIAVIRHDAAYKKVWSRLNGMGGLVITTTLDRKDQKAANHAVNYQLPPPPSNINTGGNADTEVLIQPGTGDVRAIAIDRPYGVGKHKNLVNYAVGPQYDGSEGVQLGSAGKVWTMVTALEQGIPFGYTKHVTGTATVGGFTNCQGQPLAPWHLTNDQSELNAATYSLYTGTTDSINVFFAYLEQKVGLCSVIKTASKMGLTWPDGKSLLKPDRREHHLAGADNDPSFTLGADNLAPIDVAASDATLPARGIYCSPIAIAKIETVDGQKLPVESANCHRAISQAVADAANYILQGDLTSGTAIADQIGRPSASKTGTADSYASAYFVGYTPQLLGDVWVGNPAGLIPMEGYPSGCYREDIPSCGAMYGSMAPGHTWQMTFEAALRGEPAPGFVPPDPASPLFSLGNGQTVAQPKPPGHHPGPPPPGGGGHHGGGGGGHHGGGGPPNGGH
jgi:membrane peptidoglycan carboxypeptidase